MEFGVDNFEVKVILDGLSNYRSKKIENDNINRFNSIIEGYNLRLNDLSNISETGPGRPAKDRSNKIRIGFEGTIPLKVRLSEEAERRNISLSALIREILERHFEER